MNAIRHDVSPDDVGQLRDHLKSYIGQTIIYLELLPEGSPFADYVVEIRGNGGSIYEYILGGHGIGSNRRNPVTLDATIKRILEETTDDSTVAADLLMNTKMSQLGARASDHSCHAGHLPLSRQR